MDKNVAIIGAPTLYGRNMKYLYQKFIPRGWVSGGFCNSVKQLKVRVHLAHVPKKKWPAK